MAIEDSPKGLVYLFFVGYPEWAISANLFNTLLETDLDGQFIPGLADEWSVSDDGLTYTFELNADAQWSDGEPLTAEDVVWTAQEVWSKLGMPGEFSSPDAHTVVITHKEPYAATFNRMSGNLTVLPKHVYEGSGPDYATNPANDNPVVSGAYRLKEWRKGEFVELVPNPTYFRPGKPCLDRLIFQTITDPNSRVVAFERGEVDFLYSYLIPYDKVASYQSQPDKYQVVETGLGIGPLDMLLMNTSDERLSNPAVRQAIAHAIDRDELNERALFGLGRPGTSILSSTQGFYEPTYDYDFDPTEAERMLDEAGFPRGSDGTRFSLSLDFAAGRDYESRMADVIKSQLADIGVSVTVATSDFAAFGTKVFANRDFDLAIQLWITGADPTSSVVIRYSKATIGKPFQNAMGYDNPEVESLFAGESKRADPSTRRADWVKIQELIAADAPTIPLVEIPNIQLSSARLHDFVTSSLFGYGGQPRDAAWVDP